MRARARESKTEEKLRGDARHRGTGKGERKIQREGSQRSGRGQRDRQRIEDKADAIVRSRQRERQRRQGEAPEKRW